MSIETTISNLQRRVTNIERQQLPFALSQALRRTVTEGSHKAAKGAQDELDDPTPQFTKGAARGDKRRGVFRHRWDNKRAIQSKGVLNAEGAVFVIKPLVDELSNIIFGLPAKKVPEGSKNNSVITPTRAVLKGLAGRGRLRKLNKYGNIPGLLQGALSKARDNKQFLNVPLGTSDSRLKHLHPGLYIRVKADSSTGRQSRRRRRAAKTGLMLLVAYERERRYKRQFNYESIVKRSMSQTFPQVMEEEFIKAVRTAR